MITDHNNVDAKPFEGYRDGVLVIVGSELSTTAGHLLGLGLADPTYRFSGDARDGLEDIRDLGGFAFAAHPLSPRDDLRFTGWDLPGPWGLELVNGDSEWRSAGARVLLSAGLYGLNHRYALLRMLNPADATLARWDALLAERDVVGLAGADAHSRLPLTKTRSLRFPSYESLFGLLRNHVLLKAPLTGRFEEDRAAVLEALRQGRALRGPRRAGSGRRLLVRGRGGGSPRHHGRHRAARAGLRLKAGGRLPEGARLVLLRDGKRLAEATSPRGRRAGARGLPRGGPGRGCERALGPEQPHLRLRRRHAGGA